jgi:hypothetical protein
MNWSTLAWFRANAAASTAAKRRIAYLSHQLPSETFALSPFAPLCHDGRWWLAAILPPMPAFDPEWHCSGDVLLIDPGTGAMTLLGDDNAQLVGPEAAELNVYTNGLTMARVWTALRADWIGAIWERRRDEIANHETRYPGQPYKALHPAAEPPMGCMPGMALCGPFEQLTDLSPLRQAQSIIVDSRSLVKPIEDRLLAAARVPTVSAALVADVCRAEGNRDLTTTSNPSCAPVKTREQTKTARPPLKPTSISLDTKDPES